MALNLGGLGGAFSGLINTVTTGVTSLAQGATGVITGTLGAVAPIATAVVNSTAGSILAGGVASKLGGNAGTIGASAVSTQYAKDSTGEVGFFDYKNADGTWNTKKMMLHGLGLVTIVGLVYVIGKKARWW